VVRAIYDRFALPYPEDGDELVRSYLAANAPQKHGVHRYCPEAFGLVPDRVRDCFGANAG
jgi:hypothetical protein